MKKIILASTSPRRNELMKLLGIPFEVIASELDESSIKEKDPERLVQILAQEKAKAVSKGSKNSIVIGADTIVYHKGKIIGKPKDKKHAAEILRSLSGQQHSIFTGFAIIDSDNDKSFVGVASAKVTMKELNDAEINSYIATEEPMDKAGAYGIQGIGGLLVEKLNGHFYDVVGLPLTVLRKELKKFGVRILE